MADLSYKIARELLRYCPETGKLFWLPRPVEMFSDSNVGAAGNAKRWNTKYAGKEAISLNDIGYIHIRIFGRRYLAHRLAWLLHTGAWPIDQLDHINGDRADNRIENLREVTHTENCRNQRLHAHNTSGIAGVFWKKREQKWRAQIRVDGRNKYLGRFDRIELAAAARAEANVKFGFHPNHGRKGEA